jgi:cyclophilin family peptidyl-prolyl cis-trans isomerase
VEALEDRCVPSANLADSLGGVAFVDHNGTGTFGPGDVALPGVTVNLSGTTYLGTSISASATTDANGSFRFLNVPRGTYRLSSGPATGYLAGSLTFGGVRGPTGVNVVSGVALPAGQSVSAGVGFRGLAPEFISLALFLSTTTAADFPTGAGGSGSAAASGPFLRTPVAAVSLANGTATQVIDLAGHFSAPDLGDSMVRLDVSAGTFSGAVNLELFDQQAPQTVQNFIDYINSGQYTNTVFHRLTNLSKDGLAVLQAGGFTFTAGTSGTTLPAVPAFPNVADEVGAPNTAGTIAMAKTGSADSANSQFFFNLADNSTALSPQNQSNGGFTVFGKIADAASQQVVDTLAALPVSDESAANGAMNEIPLSNYTGTNFPSDATASNFVVVTDAKVISRNEVLTYTASSSDPGVVTATINPADPERLTLGAAGVGSATVTVTATDQFGSSATTTFTVTVTDQPPTATVTLSSASPNPTDTLTATATDSDPDGNPVTLTYVWQVNGTTVKTTPGTGSLTDTLDLTAIAGGVNPGDTVTVQVTPNDGVLNGTAATASATVNSPPVVTSLGLSPSSPNPTDTLTATAVTGDPDGDPVTLTYLWQVNGMTVQTTPGTASLTDTLNPTALGLTLNSGDKVTVQATPNDGKIDGAPSTTGVTIA